MVGGGTGKSQKFSYGSNVQKKSLFLSYEIQFSQQEMRHEANDLDLKA